MRALTIKQPWAAAITHGKKRCENRTWATKYRGALLIHAGATVDRHAILPFGKNSELPAWGVTRSAIVAVAELVDVHPGCDCCRPWGEPHVYHWQLDDVRPLPEPVPCKGRLGLWTPDADLTQAVNYQLGEA